MKVMYIGPREGIEAARKALLPMLELVDVKPQPEAVAEILKSAVAVIDGSMKVRMTDGMFRLAANLRVISCATTGSDHIERTVLRERNIPVHTLFEDKKDLLWNLTTTPEHSFALLLACARRLVAAAAHVKRGEWNREEFPGVMLKGKTLGVIGVGRVGSWMARYARAFDMSVLGYDPHADSMPDGVRKCRELSELLSSSDFITVHVPLSDETRNLLSRDMFRKIKRGAVVINTSRGAIIDEGALLDALKSGNISAAGLDVLDGEPDTSGHPLVMYARENDNLVITPHCAGFSPDAVALVCERAAQKINRYFGK